MTVSRPPASSPVKWIRGFRIVGAAYALLLTYLLLVPHPLWFLGSTGVATETVVDETLADYAQHALAYAVLGVLITAGTWGQSRRTRRWWLAAAVAHGVLCECIQHYVPHRHFGVLDALANGVGVLAGSAMAAAACRRMLDRAQLPRDLAADDH